MMVKINPTSLEKNVLSGQNETTTTTLTAAATPTLDSGKLRSGMKTVIESGFLQPYNVQALGQTCHFFHTAADTFFSDRTNNLVTRGDAFRYLVYFMDANMALRHEQVKVKDFTEIDYRSYRLKLNNNDECDKVHKYLKVVLDCLIDLNKKNVLSDYVKENPMLFMAINHDLDWFLKCALCDSCDTTIKRLITSYAAETEDRNVHNKVQLMEYLHRVSPGSKQIFSQEQVAAWKQVVTIVTHPKLNRFIDDQLRTPPNNERIDEHSRLLDEKPSQCCCTLA